MHSNNSQLYGHCAQQLTWMISFNPHDNPVRSDYTPHFTERKLRHRQAKKSA